MDNGDDLRDVVGGNLQNPPRELVRTGTAATAADRVCSQS